MEGMIFYFFQITVKNDLSQFIAVGKRTGSNVVNIILIVGFAACVHPIRVKTDVIKKELPILIVVTSLFVLSILFHLIGFSDKQYILNRQDGFLFVSAFIMFIFYIILYVI